MYFLVFAVFMILRGSVKKCNGFKDRTEHTLHLHCPLHYSLRKFLRDWACIDTFTMRWLRLMAISGALAFMLLSTYAALKYEKNKGGH